MRRIRSPFPISGLLLLFLPLTVWGQIPIPAPIGGTVTVDGVQVTQSTDDGLSISVTRPDGTAFDPPARNENGLNSSDFYLINIPIFDSVDQPGGAEPKSQAMLRATRNGQPLTISQPSGGAVTVGESGSQVQRIDIVAATGGGSQNQAPNAEAGPDRTVTGGETVTLDPSGSADPDSGDVLTFQWLQTDGPAVDLTEIGDGRAAFLAPLVSAGETAALRFQLTVTDDGGLSDADSVTVTVQGGENRPPVANAGPDQSVTSGERVLLDGGNSTDPDSATNGIADFQWRQIAGTTVSLGGTGVPGQVDFIAPAVAGGGEALLFELTVTDAGGLTGTDQVTVNVAANGNTPPEADAGPDRSVSAGEVVTLDGRNSTDPDPGDAIAGYAWRQLSGPAVLLADEDTARARFTAPAVVGGAALTFELRVADTGGLQATDEMTVNVVSAGNRPPVADAGPDQRVREGDEATLQGGDSFDPDGIIGLFLWSQISGPAVVLDDAKLERPRFIAPEVGPAGAVLVFELTVVDDGLLESSDRTRVEVISVGRPPLADAGPNQTVNSGDRVLLDGGFSMDEDGRIVSYQWEQFSGTAVALSHPDREVATFYAPGPGEILGFRLTVVDDDGLSDSDEVSVVTRDADPDPGGQTPPPVAVAGPDAGALEPFNGILVPEGFVTALNGTRSRAGNNGELSFFWHQLSGPPVSLGNPAAVQTTFLVPQVDRPNVEMVFQLTVVELSEDGFGNPVTRESIDEVTYIIEDEGQGTGDTNSGCFLNTLQGASPPELSRRDR
ncbi:MAG: PKD domain-containing protein [Desulfococcaceae bacterium]